MKLEIFIEPHTSPFGEDTPAEVIRSTRYRVVIRADRQCWELQERHSVPPPARWRHITYTRSRRAIEQLWCGLHGSYASHCWPELAYLPAIFGGGS